MQRLSDRLTGAGSSASHGWSSGLSLLCRSGAGFSQGLLRPGASCRRRSSGHEISRKPTSPLVAPTGAPRVCRGSSVCPADQQGLQTPHTQALTGEAVQSLDICGLATEPPKLGHRTNCAYVFHRPEIGAGPREDTSCCPGHLGLNWVPLLTHHLSLSYNICL